MHFCKQNFVLLSLRFTYIHDSMNLSQHSSSLLQTRERDGRLRKSKATVAIC